MTITIFFLKIPKIHKTFYKDMNFEHIAVVRKAKLASDNACNKMMNRSNSTPPRVWMLFQWLLKIAATSEAQSRVCGKDLKKFKLFLEVLYK